MKNRTCTLSMLAAMVFLAQSCVCYQVTPDSPFYDDCQEIIATIVKSAIIGAESWEDPIGFQAGAEFPVKQIIEPITLRAGALVSLQGAGWEEDELVGKTNLLYAYVPVTLRYQHPSGFYGQAGLQPGILLMAKDKFGGESFDYMDFMNKFDLSIPLIIGYKLKNNIGVNLRVVPGLNDITKDEIKDRNFVVGLGLTYSPKLKK